MHISRAVRPCCGHAIEVSYSGYCTLLTCDCICRDHCAHLQVTVPGDARRGERLHGALLYGWCRACRIKVDDAHIRSLRPQRNSRMAIYWLAEADDSIAEFQPLLAAKDEQTAAASDPQLTLFSLTS